MESPLGLLVTSVVKSSFVHLCLYLIEGVNGSHSERHPYSNPNDDPYSRAVRILRQKWTI